ncbi:scavenger receptor cysteine-rich type 1 protein M130-like isoform X2 [Lepisosteus oculatus]|uniref:scavenger receptor cysteine-rich type 1 protein M130-like isoform X2 n=1 Tax=Lepisosteus oculatus TaxID=7918 RepID=UPI0035F50E47
MEKILSVFSLAALLRLSSTGGDIGYSESGFQDLRLVRGGSSCAGTVEFQYKGKWGTVAHQGWDLDDAGVVCRQLDCGAAVAAPGGAHFGPGSGPVLVRDVACKGSESTLRKCRSTELKGRDAPHDADAGAICSASVDLRLVNGSAPCSGRVELLHGGRWGTLPRALLTGEVAAVICRQLFCGAAQAGAVAAAGGFGEGAGPVWTFEAACNGSEPALRLCAAGEWRELTGNHSDDAGVSCSGNVDVRLVNGANPCEGTVEIHYKGEWGTVAYYDWDIRDATVVCRQLVCGYAVSVPIQGQFGPGSGAVLLASVFCNGTESSLKECTIIELKHLGYPHIVDAGVICSGIAEVRLVNEGSPCAGTVEFYHKRRWMIIDHAGWDLHSASVVCKQLSCGPALSADPGRSHSGTDPGAAVLSGVSCDGSESALQYCRPGKVREQQRVSWEAGAVCSGHRAARLAGGWDRCSGRLEVLRGTTWGSVCRSDFDRPSAEVVCRELHCGTLEKVGRASYFGRGGGPVWSGALRCRGNESRIFFCPPSPTNTTNCTLGEEAGLVCAGRDGLFGITSTFYRVYAALVVCGLLGMISAVALARTKSKRKGDGAREDLPRWRRGRRFHPPLRYFDRCIQFRAAAAADPIPACTGTADPPSAKSE